MANIIAPFTAASDRGYKFLRVFDQYYVARGGRAVLYVEGGIAPYDWTVTGSDFTLDAAQTAVQYNFIDVAADAVLDNTETITITDANNVSVTIVVCTCNISSTSCTTDLESCSVAPVVLLMSCTSVVITAVGGCPPYHWEITASTGDVELAAEYTNSPVNKVRCIDADCYTTGCEFTVTVTDANSDVVVCGLGCDANIMTLDDGATDDTVDFATPATVTITGGFGPYLWEISGLGHSISPSGSSSSQVATVSTIQGTCGNQVSPYCTITVTDTCGTVVTHIIRNLEAVGAGWEGIASIGNTCTGAWCYCSAGPTAYSWTGLSLNGVYPALLSGNYYTNCADTYGKCNVANEPNECGSSITLGTGSSCGGTTALRADVEIIACPAACWDTANLYYWTCGSACT